MNVPSYHWKGYLQAYLVWEKKMELILGCRKFYKLKKVGLAHSTFTYYVIMLWDQICIDRNRKGEGPIEVTI